MKRKTHEQYVLDVQEINHNITVLERYTTCRTKLLHKCNICNDEWLALPSNILNGRGCPTCGRISNKNSTSKTHEEYEKELDSTITVLDKYINAKTPITHLCNKCDNIWDDSPTHILSGRFCPKCKPSVRGFGYLNSNSVPKKAALYVIDVLLNDGEAFTKIGITCQVLNNRIKSIKSDIGVNTIKTLEILYVVEDTGINILNLERKLLVELVRDAYFPKTRFSGYTEVFKPGILPKILEILNENI